MVHLQDEVVTLLIDGLWLYIPIGPQLGIHTAEYAAEEKAIGYVNVE